MRFTRNLRRLTMPPLSVLSNLSVTARTTFERVSGLMPLRPAASPSHARAHACACIAALFVWLSPAGLFAPRTSPLSVEVSPLSEEEIDDALRRAASAALGGREGTVVVMDARDGRVRASVNPHLAFSHAAAPGSAIKPFTLLAALDAGTVDGETRAFCRGRYARGDFEMNCSHPRYKTTFGPSQALAHSCNRYFAGVGEALEGARFVETLERFGFGARTGGGGEAELAGALPHAEVRVTEMLGESERLLVTPAQLLTAYAALFNGGRLLTPRRARPGALHSHERARVEMKDEHRALLVEGMRGAVTTGTASRSGLERLPLAVFGKTGTSTPRDEFRPQGWFVGLAGDGGGLEAFEPERIKLAVVVFLRRGRGSDAAELARPVFEEYARLLSRGAGHDRSGFGAAVERGDASAPVDDGAAADASSSSGSTVRVRMTRERRTVERSTEDYVLGVIAAEASVEYELEALKALAVVARTYAARNLGRHARDGAHLCDTTHCQRFIVHDETARPDFYELARRAVKETAGEVLRDGTGGVAETYFSASCGGMTADAASLWGTAPSPSHLRSVRDEACASGLHSEWTDAVRATDLLRALRADRRTDVGARLSSVRVVRRDASGRAALVALDGERRLTVRGWDFKIIVGRTLGWNVLKSSRFDVARAGENFIFRGSGFGHGLGLCQAGAHAMAARGASYKSILERYLPGTRVGRKAEGAKTVSRAAGGRERASGATVVASAQTREASRAFARVSDYEVRRAVRADDESRLVEQIVHAGLSGRGVEREDDEGVEREDGEDDEDDEEEGGAVFLRASFERGRARLSSENFRLNYPRGVERREAGAVLRALEDARRDVARRLERAALRVEGVGRVDVFVHETTGDFTGATGQPAWVAAVTEGRRIELQPLEVLRRRGIVTTTLRHEYVHAVCEALGRGPAPRWAVEGLASHVAGEGASLARHAPRRRIALDELERRLARPASAEEMRSLYAAAHAEVVALIRREGEEAAWRRATGR